MSSISLRTAKSGVRVKELRDHSECLENQMVASFKHLPVNEPSETNSRTLSLISGFMLLLEERPSEAMKPSDDPISNFYQHHAGELVVDGWRILPIQSVTYFQPLFGVHFVSVEDRP
jgi:hypothetical protein